MEWGEITKTGKVNKKREQLDIVMFVFMYEKDTGTEEEGGVKKQKVKKKRRSCMYVQYNPTIYFLEVGLKKHKGEPL